MNHKKEDKVNIKEISYELGATIPVANYANIKPVIKMTVEVQSSDNEDTVFKKLKDKVEKHLTDTVKELKKKKL